MAIATAPVEVRYWRPALYPKQEAAIFTPARYALVEASSKAGKTVGCICWLIEQALAAHRGQHAWWLAPVYSQAKIAYRRLKAALPRELYTANDTDMTVTLFNGVMLWFKSAEKPDSLFGEDVVAAVIDEASRVREESWHAVRTTLTATRGPLRIIGNVKGRRNWFYHLARRAESGEPEMAYAKITARDAVDAGVLAAEEVADAARLLPAAVYQELYEAEASDDAGNPFGLSAIRLAVRPGLSSAPPAVWGADIAKHVDYSVAIALDAAGAVCRFERWQGPLMLTAERLASLLGTTPALVDATHGSQGDAVIEQLQKIRGHHVTGFQFTAPSKQALMEKLAVAIQQGEVTYPDGPIVQELESFEYEYTRTGVRYAAAEGLHDDCVCALALAVAQRGKPPPPRWEAEWV